jgi:uncharacterized protein
VLELVVRNLPDLIVLSIVILIQFTAAMWVLRGPARSAAPWIRWSVGAVTVLSSIAVTLALGLRFARIARYFPGWWLSWGRAWLVIWSLLSVFLFVALLVSRLLPSRSRVDGASRRRFLTLARGALFAGPAAAMGYGTFIERTRIRLREQTIPVPGLPPDLEGLSIVQLSDIHMSPFLTARELARAVDIANETRARLALVTGDLITGRGDPVDACLDGLARLRADAGVFGCMGNHEIYAEVEDYVERRGRALGMTFLRQVNTPLTFGNGVLNLAGVDYQQKRRPYLHGAESLIRPGAFNVLLSHNPDVFPVAARMGFDLTISGHTHGGQIRVEIVSEDLNIARFYTPYVDGLYRRGNSSVFVTRGIGTIVLPARIGAPPEVALLRLSADSNHDSQSAGLS